MHGMPDCITRGLPYRSMRNQCVAALESAHATFWYRRHSAVATYLASSVEGIYMHLCTCACARIDTAWPRQAAHTRSMCLQAYGPPCASARDAKLREANNNINVGKGMRTHLSVWRPALGTRYGV